MQNPPPPPFTPPVPPPAPTRTNPHRRAIITIAVVIGLAVGAGVGGLLGARSKDAHWKPLYNSAVEERDRSRSSAEGWQSTAEEWQRSSKLNDRQLRELEKKVSATVGDLDNPHFTLWSACEGSVKDGCPLTPGHEYVGAVPDTFTYHIAFRSTVPVTVWIMSTSDFVCWETRLCAWHGLGWEDRTRLDNGIFHQAEGCAGYIAVFFSNQAGTLYPDVSVTRNPAKHTTGACRSS